VTVQQECVAPPCPLSAEVSGAQDRFHALAPIAVRDEPSWEQEVPNSNYVMVVEVTSDAPTTGVTVELLESKEPRNQPVRDDIPLVVAWFAVVGGGAVFVALRAPGSRRSASRAS
jgi:hypothetical protein